MRKLVAFQDEAEVAYTSMASLSVDPPEVTAAFRAGLGRAGPSSPIPSVSTSTRSTCAKPPTPSTIRTGPAVFVLAPDLTVHSAYNGYWYWGRPGLDELRGDLRSVTRAIRTDWEVPR